VACALVPHRAAVVPMDEPAHTPDPTEHGDAEGCISCYFIGVILSLFASTLQVVCARAVIRHAVRTDLPYAWCATEEFMYTESRPDLLAEGLCDARGGESH
jgi:hypothetical protein